MVKKGTPARVEPAGSFLPVVPEEEQQDPGEAAGSAAANPTAASQVEGAEAAGSAAARPPRGREGRGRAGKSVNRKEDRKVYYEAQDLYRQYWGVRQTSRIKYEDATREYCAELLDFYNWHYSCGPYAAAEEFDEEVPAGSEQPESAGSAASAEVATDRVVETGSEVLESGTASTVVLTPRQPEGPPPGFVSGATSQSRRPASPPVRRHRSRTSSAPATDRVAGRAAPSEAPRASSVGPVVGQVEGGHRRRRRTSDRRGRAEEGKDVARKPPSPPTERSRSTEVARRRERRQRPVVEQVAGIPAAVPDQETPPTYRIDRRGVWKLIRPAEGVAPTQRLVEVRPEGAGQAAPAGAEEDPHELADEAWVSPTGGQHRVERRGDSILIHRGTAVHDLTTGDNAILREAFAEGEIIEAQPVEPTPKRSATVVAPEPKRQRRNYTFFEDRDRSKRPQTWFGDPVPAPEGAGSAAPASSALAASAKASAPPPPPPVKRKAPPRAKATTEEPKASASATVDVEKSYKAPPQEVPQQVPHPREAPGVVRDPRIYQTDRPFKNPPPELSQGAGAAAPKKQRFSSTGLDLTYGHPYVADRAGEPIRIVLDYHNVLDLHEQHNIHSAQVPYYLDNQAVEFLQITAQQYNIEWDILSFVKGQGGVRYVQPRIDSIARFLRQKGIPVRYAELCFEKVGRDGKADWLYRHKAHGILDDSDNIIAECKHRGHFAVQVNPQSRSIRDAIFALRLELQNSSHEEFLRHYSPWQ